MSDHIDDLAGRLREASGGCLLHYHVDGGSITETVGLTSREKIALAVQILTSWCDDEGADHDEVLGAMRVSNLVERMGVIEDVPVHVKACCVHCRHASPVPRDSGDRLAVTCQRNGVEMPQTLVCTEFAPRLRVAGKRGPYGCLCQDFAHHVAGDGCCECNPELALEAKENDE